MATNGPSNQVHKARQVSKNLLTLNSSAVSQTADSLFSVLDGGQDSTYVRRHLADLMEQISR